MERGAKSFANLREPFNLPRFLLSVKKTMSMIGEGLQAVNARIARAAAAAGRDPKSIRLVAVTKTHAPARVEEAYRVGQCDFGENYVQEALEKMDALPARLGKALAERPIEWHLIGPLQANKTRQAAERFSWVHTIDREKIARRLSEQRSPGSGPVNVLLQINISGEATKSGVSPAEAIGLARALDGLSGLRLRGLMAVPEPTADVTLQRARFREVRAVFETLNTAGLRLDTLSMGMSADLEAAIAEGSTMVRVGTAIFGERAALGSSA